MFLVIPKRKKDIIVSLRKMLYNENKSCGTQGTVA